MSPSRSHRCRSIPHPYLMIFLLLVSSLSRENRIAIIPQGTWRNPSFLRLEIPVHLTPLYTQRSPPPSSSLFLQESIPCAISGQVRTLLQKLQPPIPPHHDAHIELYNIENRTTKNYLSTGQTQLPSLFFIFSGIYLWFLGFWVGVCFKNQRSFRRIHFLMGCMLVMMALNLFCESQDKYHVKRTGIHQESDVSLYNFQFLRFVAIFTLAIVAGWCQWKTGLQEKNNDCMMISISVPVMTRVAFQLIDETVDIGSLNVGIYTLMILCATFSPLYWPLKRYVNQEEELTRFEIFFVLSCCWAAIMDVSGLHLEGYKYQWVFIAVVEISYLVFFTGIFYFFHKDEDEGINSSK